MPYDFEVEAGLTFGEWLHRQVHAGSFVETHGWAGDRARRVAERLQADRPPAERMVVEVPWIDQPTAFTAPGRYIYVSRRLLERCPDDETAAFIVAHEVAHHDLRHVARFAGWAGRVARIPAIGLLAGPFQAVERRLYGPELECAADRHALSLCIRAGYEPLACLRLFDIMENLALDAKDDAMVYGPDPSDDELAGDASWKTRLRIWAWQRARGYLPIRDRKAVLIRHLRHIGPTLM